MTNDYDSEPQELVRVDNATLAAISGAEIDQQITTAHKFPRSIKKFLQEVEQMACLNEDMASECFYSLPRRNQDGQMVPIEGPSARFAEIVASAWGNSRAGARIISEEQDFVVAQGAFHDLERNVAISFEVRRRITGKNGRRYSPDMIGVTATAAASIALRNAVLKGVPKAFWKPAYEAARKTAIGDAKTLEGRRVASLQHFAKMGVAQERIFLMLGVKGVEDVTLDHLAQLKGIATALRDGDVTIEQAFPPAHGATTAELAKNLGASPEAETAAHIALAATTQDQFRERRIKADDVKAAMAAMGIKNPPSQLARLAPDDLKALRVRLGLDKEEPKAQPADPAKMQELTDAIFNYAPPTLHAALVKAAIGRDVTFETMGAADADKVLAYIKEQKRKEAMEA